MDRGLGQNGLPARPGGIETRRLASVGRIGDGPVTAEELYNALVDDAFHPAEQGLALGYLNGLPVVVELEPAGFVDLIISFYDRVLQEVCEC